VKETDLDYSHYFWQGKKVRLRPLQLEDAEAAFIGMLDSPSRRHLQLGVEMPTSLESLRSSLEKWVDCKEADGAIVFTVETLEGENVGGISLHSRDRKNGIFSFGVGIDRPHRRQGYAEDAVKILLRYGFRERRFQKCNSGCTHTNEASLALHKKLGFTEEGRVRRRWFFDGQYHDDVLFGMTIEEFEAQQSG
jgi:RimJ/RimL family protein N-acetyltransferase